MHKKTKKQSPKSNSVMFGAPKGTRTPDLLLRRQLLYPAELLAHVEQMMGIEPTRSAWKAEVLPLNYICIVYCSPATKIIISYSKAVVNIFFIFFCIIIFIIIRITY